MKKFCSKCGNQLDLGKKQCTHCHAFNPYFISGFNDTVQTKPGLQEELLITKEHALASEAALRAEQIERERAEQNLKNELLKVKEDTEQYKKETLNLVIGVQKELQDIGKENQILKERVQQLNSNVYAEQPPLITAAPVSEAVIVSPESSRAFFAVAAIVLAILVSGILYYALNKNVSKENIVSPASVSQAHGPVAAVVAQPNKSMVQKPKADSSFWSLPEIKPAAEASTTMAPKAVKAAFSPTASKIIGDLVGKKLSGCDITINSSSEISQVDHVVLVEKLTATYLKYKCTIKVTQGNDVFTASPYIYYSTEGALIKVDGTNCE